MVPPTQNRLLPILAGVVVAALVVVMFKSCRETGPTPRSLGSVPVAPSADADTPADTIKTLTANVVAMTTEVQALRHDNASLKKDNQTLLADRSQIEEHLNARLDESLANRVKAKETDEAEHESALTALAARVDALADSLSASPAEHQGADIPVGLGLAAAAETLTWVEPLDKGEIGSGADGHTLGLAQSWTADAGGKAGAFSDEVGERVAMATPKPVYTVPRNATLIGSTAMTALVGRVPVQGQVRDPMPFKVITGAENLAANGLTVPGVQGMIWSGTAVGDWTLSCVTGQLESVTFVFDDGTIRTVSTDDKDLQGSETKKSLAWISDDHGIPCVSGERKTNAPAFLAQRIGVTAIGAAAEAIAAAQTTTIVNDSGAINHSLTGNLGPYALGKTVSGGSDEIAKWLLERQAQSFDAVFVPAGVKLAIHVDRELLIDFERNGRRLSHAISRDAALHSHLD